MVHISVIEASLSKLGIHLSRWYQPEVRELQHVLLDNERIVAAVPGRYFAGYALLVATDLRLLLIDKRTFFITMEDIRYDMISETDFTAHMVGATVQIYTLNKQHRFTAMKYKKQLRDLTTYVQRRVMELRQPVEQPSQDLYHHTLPYHPLDHHDIAVPRYAHHTPKAVGAAALTAATRTISFRPRVPHVSTTYTGPAVLNSIFTRQQ